jgi:bifunctional non-homologous end joining protein LigD
MSNNYAPGLPSKTKFDQINQSGPTRLVIQEHRARNKHYDLRLQDGDIAHSWVIRSLPGEKRLTLAIRQPTHKADYMDFEGKIEKGYGRGSVFKTLDTPVMVEQSNNNKIKMILPNGKFIMIRPKKFKKHNWLLIKTGCNKNLQEKIFNLSFIDELQRIYNGCKK